MTTTCGGRRDAARRRRRPSRLPRRPRASAASRAAARATRGRRRCPRRDHSPSRRATTASLRREEQRVVGLPDPHSADRGRGGVHPIRPRASIRASISLLGRALAAEHRHEREAVVHELSRSASTTAQRSPGVGDGATVHHREELPVVDRDAVDRGIREAIVISPTATTADSASSSWPRSCRRPARCVEVERSRDPLGNRPGRDHSHVLRGLRGGVLGGKPDVRVVRQHDHVIRIGGGDPSRI